MVVCLDCEGLEPTLVEMPRADIAVVGMPALGVGQVVLLRADLFDSIKDLLDEKKQRQIAAKIAMRNAIGRMNGVP
jgi:hypothetical protein